jgi:hypothetical protein
VDDRDQHVVSTRIDPQGRVLVPRSGPSAAGIGEAIYTRYGLLSSPDSTGGVGLLAFSGRFCFVLTFLLASTSESQEHIQTR